jgi:hypothetical protein
MKARAIEIAEISAEVASTRYSAKEVSVRTNCDSSTFCTVRRLSLILLNSVFIMLTLLAFSDQRAAGATKVGDGKQHFVCNAGYTFRDCEVATKTLSKAIAKYPIEALGEWRWVLVRSEDWKEILTARRFDPNCPAFSYLPERETFLDGSLLSGVSIRGVELRMVWHMSTEALLDLAVRHELAHALCNEYDESKAEREAKDLKNKVPLSCLAIR